MSGSATCGAAYDRPVGVTHCGPGVCESLTVGLVFAAPSLKTFFVSEPLPRMSISVSTHWGTECCQKKFQRLLSLPVCQESTRWADRIRRTRRVRGMVCAATLQSLYAWHRLSQALTTPFSTSSSTSWMEVYVPLLLDVTMCTHRQSLALGGPSGVPAESWLFFVGGKAGKVAATRVLSQQQPRIMSDLHWACACACTLPALTRCMSRFSQCATD